jgi:hypothetical protein
MVSGSGWGDLIAHEHSRPSFCVGLHMEPHPERFVVGAAGGEVAHHAEGFRSVLVCVAWSVSSAAAKPACCSGVTPVNSIPLS